MEKIFKIIFMVIMFVSCFFPNFQDSLTTKSASEADYRNLGIPLSEYYPDGIPARTPWDVEIYDEKLFVAAGDYDKNSGPVPIYYYDIASQNWVNSGTVPDEQIEHFKVIHNTLMIPGCDPQCHWDYGSIYVYENKQWTNQHNIPGGVHQFDLVEFQDEIFVGLGILPGNTPIAKSTDGGKTFCPADIYKNGTKLDTTVPPDAKAVQLRVYDFFTFNGQLFAYYRRFIDNVIENEIYRYENGAFYYHQNLTGPITINRSTYRVFDEKTEYQGKLYFTTGNLYTTSDFQTIEHIPLVENSIVTDLCVIEDSLYVITAIKHPHGTYRTTLWRRQNGSQELYEDILFFDFPCPAQCFTYNNGILYFGMGDGILSESNPYNGTILSIDIVE